MSGLGWIIGAFIFTSCFLTLAKITPSSFRISTSGCWVQVLQNISSIGNKCLSSKCMVHAHMHGWIGTRYWWVWLFPGLRLGGNRRVVMPRISKISGVLRVQGTSEGIDTGCDTLLTNGRQVSRMMTHKYWIAAAITARGGKQRWWAGLSKVRTFSFRMSKIQVLNTLSARCWAQIWITNCEAHLTRYVVG